MGHEVCITGVGTTTPLGHGFGAFADNLLSGCSGVGRVNGFDISEHPSQIAAQIDEVPCPSGWKPELFRQLARLSQAILWCCTAALLDAGWWEARQQLRVGLVLGLGAEWLAVWESDARRNGNLRMLEQQL